MELAENIITGELRPQSFGQFIDALMITNMRMWHAQEFFYELDLLKQLSKEEMYDKLRFGSWLNLQRNIQMDGLDASLAARLNTMFPELELLKEEVSEQTTIWEKL
jgi:hypothetical protein